MIQFNSFQSRLLFFFLGLFVFIQVIAFLIINASNEKSANAQVRNELILSGRVFNRIMDTRTRSLSDASKPMSNDFAFKTAYFTHDKNTLLSAMENHKARIKADIMMMVSLDNLLVADTLNPKSRSSPCFFPDLIKTAEDQGESFGIVIIRDKAYQMVVIPLLAPEPVAWICMGFEIGDDLTADIKKLTRSDVTFVLGRKNNPEIIIATTLDDLLRDSLKNLLKNVPLEMNSIASMNINNDEFITHTIQVGTQGDSTLTVLLQQPLEEVLRPFKRLHTALIGLFAGGILLSLIGGIFIARGVTKPVRILAESAGKIEKGDYGHRVSFERKDEFGRLAAAFNHMTSGISQREERIKYQAYHDTLTDLPNRTSLNISLHNAILAAEPDEKIALLIIDIHSFKDINATLGHTIGDLLLQQMAPRLSTLIGSGVFVSRFGGDEFALLLPKINSVDNAVRNAEKVIKGFEEPFHVEGYPIEIEASIGIALYPEHGRDANALIQHADVAMFLAKGSVSGFSLYSPDLDQHSLRQLTLLGELRNAIGNGELLFYYQPKVSLITGRIVGAEALVRWIHPAHGFMPPDEFIPLAERTGIIRELTLWGLRTSLNQFASLNRNGIDIGMSVNLSARNLQDQELPDYLSELIKPLGIAPEKITLEITESAIMSDPQRSFDVIKRFDSLGVQLSIDDFGTGYSSMAYLQKLPVDELKIDKSFVQNMDTRTSDATIVRSIIELAHNLNLKVTAEGVETDRAWGILKKFGCDLGQGYFMSKPVPFESLIPLIKGSSWG